MRKLFSLMAAAVIVAVNISCLATRASGMSAAPVSVQSVSLSDSQLADYANQVAVLVNVERSSRGLKPLRILPKLMTAAQIRANEITQIFDHFRPNGTKCFSVLDEVGLDFYAVGENIAAGQSTPESVMSAWMTSSEHKDNILKSDFMYIGVGVVQKGNRLYWSQEFLKYNEFSDAYIPKEKTPVYGDIDSDGKIDSRDASTILAEYALVSAGGVSTLSSYQKECADIDANSKIDSRDASFVLGFYSYLSSGGKENNIKKWM